MSGKVTVKQLKDTLVSMLTIGGCEDPEFDAVCLLEDVGALGRGNVHVLLHETMESELCKHVLDSACRRAAGEPLQYLLGNWDFLGLTLYVGKGVLIPRPETEELCELVAQHLNQKEFSHTPVVWDLCAGTGCIGLGVASLCEKPIQVSAVEVSSEAFEYLQKNINKYKQYDVQAVRADILADFDRFASSADVIVSNPPYIPSNQIGVLQREVRHEPVLALDGGDGYRFYHALAKNWINKLYPDGMIAVEVGVEQAKMVADIFNSTGLSNVQIVTDTFGIERFVVAYRK